MSISRSTLTLFIFLAIFAAAPALHGAIIIEHAGANNPATEGFALYSANNSSPVTDDLGIPGRDAWHLDGNRDTTQENHHFNGAEVAALSGGWRITADLRNLSTGTGAGTGPWVTLMLSGVRFDIGLESDGDGNQILEARYDGLSSFYTISGLGQNYVLIQVDYNPASHTAAYYVNGTKVISGYAGGGTAFYDGFVFGADNGNFSLVELESGSGVPEPATAGLMIAALMAGVARRLRKRGALRP